jgi:nucleoside-diphosphate-sugar epimerase
MTVNKITDSFLSGKSVFITGATGFVGKSILELILRDHHKNLNHIYLLVRSNKSSTIQQRTLSLMKNKLFTGIKDELGADAYWEMIKNKVIPIEGDISQPKLGISSSDYDILKKNANYVIHCAATVDFNETIPKSFLLNVTGTQSVLDLCDQLDNCMGFQHVSTAYVNANLQEGKVMEMVYPMVIGEVPELLNSIPQMDAEEIQELTEKVLKVYPNTYSFTKSLTEHSIMLWIEFMRQREYSIGTRAWPVSIVRPAVVTGAAFDPLPGWVDGVSACNGVALYIGLGVMDTLPGEVGNVIDLVPVDYLAHIMLKACAAMSPPGVKFNLPYYNQPPSQTALPNYPPIYHACSSNSSPITWVDFGNWVVKGWGKLPPLKKQIYPPSFKKYQYELANSAALSFRNHIRFDLLAFLTAFKDPQSAKKLQGLKTKLQFLYHCFNHFMTHSWAFNDDNVQNLDYIMELEGFKNRVESNPFPIERLKSMNWERYVYQFVYGMHYFVLSESNSVRLPDVIPGWECALKKVQPLPQTNQDFPELLQRLPELKTDDLVIHKVLRKSLDDENIKRCIRLASSQTGQTPYEVQSTLLKSLSKLEKGAFGRSNNGYNSYAIHQIMSQYLNQAFSSLTVNRSKLIRLQSILTDSDKPTRIIYVPTHSSSLDGLILSNVLEKYKLPVPQAIAEGSDNLVSYHAANRSTILRKTPLNNSDLGSASIRQSIMITYLSQILKMGGSIALFLDPSPTNGQNGLTNRNDSLLLTLIERVQNNPDFGPVSIVPVTMNYEMVLDQDHLIQAWSTLSPSSSKDKVSLQLPSKIGSGYVNFGSPIPISDGIQNSNSFVKSDLLDCNELMIRNVHLQNQIITPTNLLAVILNLFKNNNEELKFDHCRRLMRYLKKRVTQLGHTVDWNDEEDADVILNHAIEMIGADHIEVCVANSEDVIRVNNSMYTGILLQLLVKPISAIIAYEGIWYAAYTICQQSLFPGQKTCSNEMVRMPIPSPMFVIPQKDEIYEKFKTIVHTIQQSLPSFLPNYGFDSLNHQFNLINSQLEADDLVNDMDGMIIVTSDQLRKQYLNMCLYLLNPILYSIHGTSLTLSDLAGVKQIPHSKLTQLVYEKNLQSNEAFQLYPELNSKPNIETGLQVLKWWNIIKETHTEVPIDANSPKNRPSEINWEVGNTQHLAEQFPKTQPELVANDRSPLVASDYHNLLATVYNWFNMNLPKQTIGAGERNTVIPTNLV